MSMLSLTQTTAISLIMCMRTTYAFTQCLAMQSSATIPGKRKLGCLLVLSTCHIVVENQGDYDSYGGDALLLTYKRCGGHTIEHTSGYIASSC